MKKMMITAIAVMAMGALFAQNPQNYFRVKNQFTGQFQTSPTGQQDSIWTVKLEINMTDINQFKKAHVKMRAEGQPEIINKVFNLRAPNTNLGNGISISINGNKAMVTLGNHAPDFWQWEVKLEDNAGNLINLID